jgi:hypothetical protein
MAKLIGTDPNQVPTNGDLGDLAYQNKDSVKVDNLQVDGTINENVTIDSSGNLLVGGTSLGEADSVGIAAAGYLFARRTNNPSAVIERINTDGEILSLVKDNTTVGSIGTTNGDLTIGNGDVRLRFNDSSDEITPRNSDDSPRDAAVDLGTSGIRFKDLYLSGGVYLGGTGSANKLDDYETGTWTPTFYGSTATISSASGKYIKIGNLFIGYILLDGVSSSTGRRYAVFNTPIAMDTTSLPFLGGSVSNYPSGSNHGHSGCIIDNASGNAYQIYAEWYNDIAQSNDNVYILFQHKTA